jgi:hypothetical protein
MGHRDKDFHKEMIPEALDRSGGAAAAPTNVGRNSMPVFMSAIQDPVSVANDASQSAR